MTTFSTEAILTALLLTFLAGISTGLGSLVALIPRASGNRFIAGALGLSAGVMIYVSFLDLIPMALESIAEIEPGRTGNLWVTLAFFGGIALIALIDFFIPDAENPHELHQINALAEGTYRVPAVSKSTLHVANGTITVVNPVTQAVERIRLSLPYSCNWE